MRSLKITLAGLSVAGLLAGCLTHSPPTREEMRLDLSDRFARGGGTER